YAQDPGSAGLIVGALVLWLLGYGEQARQWNDRAIMLARAAAHPYTLAYVLAHSSWFHHFRRERAVAQERAEEVIAIAGKQGLAVALAWGTLTRGWAVVEQGQREAGIAQIRQGVAAAHATGGEAFGTHRLTLLAEAHEAVGEPEAGLRVLEEALALVEKN